MRSTLIIRLFCGVAALAAVPGFASGQIVSNSPSVSHATSSALSAPLSDLPPARSAQGVQDLKVVPPPKPVPPRKGGPGGVPRGDGALQHFEGPPIGVESKTSFGGIGANGYIRPIRTSRSARRLAAPVTSSRWSTARSPCSTRAARCSAGRHR